MNETINQSIEILNALFTISKNRKEISAKEIDKLIENYKGVELLLLETDQEKTAFWLNVYNSLVFSIILKKPTTHILITYLFKIYRYKFQIGHIRISLLEIKHGILRQNRRLPLCLYKCFKKKDPRLELQATHFENRVHFAFYREGEAHLHTKVYSDFHLDFELGETERIYSSSNFIYDIEFKRIALSRFYRWYQRDFPEKYIHNPQFKHFKQTLLPYNWRDLI